MIKPKISRAVKLIFIYFSSLITSIAFGYGDNKTVYYEPACVEVCGVVNKMLFPGPPNYNNIDSGDAAEYGWYIVLEQPIDVNVKSGTESKEYSNNTPEKNINFIHIVNSDKNNWKKLKNGNHVCITGTLFHALTGHHHSMVLIDAKKVELDPVA